ncbi:MAG: glycosyltransferase family 39 protein [bacterium]
MKKHWPLLLILFLGLALRLYKITARDFWYDESFTAVLISWDWRAMWQGILNDVHPPLYYLLLKPFSLLLGWTPFGLRFFSTLFSTASIFLVYKIGARFALTHKDKAGLAAAFITAIAPFQIQYAQEARQYALMGFLALCALYFVIKKQSKFNFLLAGAFLSLTFLTQYAGILVLPAILMVAFILTFEKRFRFFTFAKKASKRIILISIPVSLAFLAWLPIFKRHRENMGNPAWIPNPTLSRFAQSIYTFVFGEWPKQAGVSVPNENFFGIGTVILGLVVLVFLVIVLAKRCKLSNFAFIIFTLTILLESYVLAHFLGINFYMERYLFTASFGIYISLGLVAARLESFKKFTGVALLGLITLLTITIRQKPLDQRFQTLAKIVPEGKYQTIVATSPFDYPTAIFYLYKKAPNFKVYNKQNPTEDLSGWVVIGPNQVDSLSNLNPQTTLVLD